MASWEIDERASGESERQAGRRKRIIWCKTLEPSTVRGTGGSAVSTGVSGAIPTIIGAAEKVRKTQIEPPIKVDERR
jgi:hypothetical protein